MPPFFVPPGPGPSGPFATAFSATSRARPRRRRSRPVTRPFGPSAPRHARAWPVLAFRPRIRRRIPRRPCACFAPIERLPVGTPTKRIWDHAPRPDAISTRPSQRRRASKLSRRPAGQPPAQPIRPVSANTFNGAQRPGTGGGRPQPRPPSARTYHTDLFDEEENAGGAGDVLAGNNSISAAQKLQQRRELAAQKRRERQLAAGPSRATPRRARRVGVIRR